MEESAKRVISTADESGPSGGLPWRRGREGRGATREHFRGCLLAGAAGDALGASVELLSGDEIRRR